MGFELRPHYIMNYGKYKIQLNDIFKIGACFRGCLPSMRYPSKLHDATSLGMETLLTARL